MDESSFFRNSDIFQEANRIIEAQSILSKLNKENFESTLLFFQNSIFATSKKLAKTFIRLILNIIRFKPKNLDLYSSLCKNIDFFSNIAGHILIEFLKNADFMTSSQFKFYRLCIDNKLLSALDVVKQISVILYFNVINPGTMYAKQLIPLFLWFCPEIYQYNITLFQWIYQKLQNVDYFTNQIDLLKYDNWSIFYQYVENQYLNLKFHPIYTEETTDSNNMKENSIEYCLKEDDVNKFQELAENKDINSTCQISLFDYIFQPTQQPTYLQFSAANSSINCFKYLFLSNANSKIEIQTQSISHILNESQLFNQKRNKKNETDIIEIDSSSDSPEEDNKSENENEEEEDVIYISDSESSETEKTSKTSKNKQKEIIIISDSSSNNNSNNNSSDDDDNEIKKDEIDSDFDNEKKIENQNDLIDKKEIEEKSKRLWMPPSQPGDLTGHYTARKPLCIEYQNLMKLKTTSQCAVAGGDNEIVRLIYDSELCFDDTPQVAISCFYNDLAKWIIEIVFSSENESFEMTPQNYAKLLYYSITTGNIEMLKYIISNMPNEINGDLSTLDFIPLHLAIKYHQVDVVSFLINLKSVDVNKEDEFTKKTPFFLAVDSKCLEMVRLIANNPFFDIDQIVCSTLKPIHYVAMFGTSKMMNFFVSLNGVDINDNVSYKIEEEREKIRIEQRKKRPKKKKQKKSKNFIDDSEFLFFLDENPTNNKSDDDSDYEYEESTNENEIENDSKSSFYYFNYKYDLYDIESRNTLLASQETSKNDFGNLINTPIVWSLLLDSIDNFFVLMNDKNLKINTRSDQMPLQLCIKRNNKQIFDYLISSRSKTNIDINIYDRCGTTPLHYAVLRKSSWAIKSLLKAGCDFTKTTKIEGDTVCHLAVFKGSLESIKRFIDAKMFDVNVVNNKKQTPLHYAAIYGSSQIVDYLLTFPEIDINAQDLDGNTPLHLCVQSSQRYIFEKLLSNHSIDVNAMNNDHETPLIFAFKFNNEQFIMKLLSLNGTINPNCVERGTGNSPLHLSVIMKSENFVRRLLKLHDREVLNKKLKETDSQDKFNFYLNSFKYEFNAEVDVNAQNLKGLTALHIAAQNKSDILVRVLLTSPFILLDIVDFSLNRCPIHYAAVSSGNCWFGMKMFNPYMYDLSKFSNTIFSQLINRDPLTGNIQDCNGDTAFHIALNDTGFDGNLLKNTANQVNKNKDDEILKLTLVNLKGENYLHLAAASGNRIVLDFMIKTHPELINEKTIDVFIYFLMEFQFFFLNNVPLHYATMNGKVEMVALLMLNDGIDKFAVNNEGKTPLEMALHDMRSQFRKYFVNK